MWLIQTVMWIIAVGVGIWYLSSSIGGGAITYASLDSFLRAIGACPNGPSALGAAEASVCDVAAARGCFLCGYIEKLFLTIGDAAMGFWNALVNNLWILMAGGFAIFLFLKTIEYIREANQKNAELSADERKLELKPWFDKVKDTGIRIMVAGVLLGAVGFGGTAVMKTVADITITPVMYVGSEMAMAATGISSSAQCGTPANDARMASNAIGPALRPFMCVIGNLNAVILAGAAGGFSLMNFSWMGLGGGLLTWLAGLALVIAFLYTGFRIFFQVLTVVFQLVFIIIMLPLLIAAWAFEGAWEIAKGVVGNAVNMLVNAAVRVVAISLKILILYATISFAADEFFPGPVDGYTAILPPGIAMNLSNAQAAGQTSDAAASVAAVFSKCERAATVSGQKDLDKDAFRDCFLAEKASVEMRHPGAFDFMDDGLSFLLMMLGLFFVYWYVVEPKVDETMKLKDAQDGKFEYGKYVREFGESLWSIPKKIGEKITGAMKK